MTITTHHFCHMVDFTLQTFGPAFVTSAWSLENVFGNACRGTGSNSLPEVRVARMASRGHACAMLSFMPQLATHSSHRHALGDGSGVCGTCSLLESLAHDGTPLAVALDEVKTRRRVCGKRLIHLLSQRCPVVLNSFARRKSVQDLSENEWIVALLRRSYLSSTQMTAADLPARDGSPRWGQYVRVDTDVDHCCWVPSGASCSVYSWYTGRWQEV